MEIDIGSTIGFGMSLWSFLHCYKQYREDKGKHDHIKSAPLLSLPDLQHMTNHQKTVLVRTSCKNSFEVKSESSEVSSNQVWSNVFPLLKHIQNLQSEIVQQKWRQQPGIESKNHIKQHQWTTEDDYALQLPKITNTNLLDYKVKYSPEDHSFFNYIIAAFAVVLDFLFRLLSLFIIDEPIIKGPKWGVVTVTASLITNVPLVLCCDLEKGNVVPRYLGLTKADILKQFSFKDSKKLMMASAAVCLFMGAIWYSYTFKKWWRPLKKWISNFLNRKYQENKPKIFTLQKFDDEQACVICYAKCRNIVFKKCKHLMVCDTCANDKVNPLTFCPICRKDVDPDDFISVMTVQELTWRVRLQNIFRKLFRS